MNSLMIVGTEIRQDADGRYCLNDLHKAAGGEKRHQPSDWMRMAQTQELIEEISLPGNPGIQSKQGLGTYVCKELVYAYAMWISAGFSLKVIRAYDALFTTPQQQLIPQTLPEALRLAADLADQKALVDAKLAIAAPKAEALDRISTQTEGSVGLRIAAKLLQMPERQFIAFANSKGFIFRNHHSRTWQGYSDKVKAGYIEMKVTSITREDNTEKTVEQVLITRLGLARLALLLGGRDELKKAG